MIYINKQLNGETEVILNAKNFPWLFENHELGGIQLTDFACKIIGDDIYIQTISLSDISQNRW